MPETLGRCFESEVKAPIFNAVASQRENWIEFEVFSRQ